MRARTAPSMAMIAIAFLLASALALALTMVGSAQERGISSAGAASRVGVTAKCDGNPEKVIVKNNTRHRIKIKKVGSIYRPYDYEPKTFNKILGRGQTATFESGPAANHNVISKQYIFNSDVGSREGARVATSIGRYVDRCN
jgi:hypothetical protein